MPRRAFPTFTALLAIVGAATLHPAAAHHGGGVEYDTQRRGPVSGTVSEFAFRFPHVQLFVDVPDDQGATTRWTLVSRWTPTILRRHGWSRETLKPGDEVTFTYQPHKESPTVGALVTLDVNGEPLPLDFD